MWTTLCCRVIFRIRFLAVYCTTRLKNPIFNWQKISRARFISKKKSILNKWQLKLYLLWAARAVSPKMKSVIWIYGFAIKLTFHHHNMKACSTKQIWLQNGPLKTFIWPCIVFWCKVMLFVPSKTLHSIVKPVAQHSIIYYWMSFIELHYG